MILNLSSPCANNSPTQYVIISNNGRLISIQSIQSMHIHHHTFSIQYTVLYITLQLRDAIKFHFNYATPSRMITEEQTLHAKRPERKKAVTALSDVLAHLRRHQRQVAAPTRLGQSNAPGSTQSTKPRMLSFTPQVTPLSHRSLFSATEHEAAGGVSTINTSTNMHHGGTIVFHNE